MKPVQQYLNRNTWRIILGLTLILCAEFVGIFHSADHFFYDLSFRARGKEAPCSQVVIVAIDEKSLSQLGRWPIKRDYYASLLDHVSMADAVGFDIIFSEPSPNDLIFAEAIEKHGRVVLPLYIDQRLNISKPAQVFSTAKAGHIHLEQDIDGKVREVFHSITFKSQTYPSLTASLYEMMPEKPGSRKKINQPSLPSFESIVQNDLMKIYFYGPRDSYLQIPLADVLDGRWPQTFFKGKTVLVGVTAAAVEKNWATPFLKDRKGMTGVEIHANILGSLIEKKEIQTVSEFPRWIILLVISLLCLCIFSSVNTTTAFMLWVSSIVLTAAAVFILFSFQNIWYAPVSLLLSLTYAFGLSYIVHLERMAAKLLQAKEDWQESFDSINDSIVIHDSQCNVIRINKASHDRFPPSLPDYLRERCRHILDSYNPEDAKSFFLKKTLTPDKEMHIEVQSFPRFDDKKTINGFVHITRDISEKILFEEEQRKLQQHLLQAQKMEAIGRLAGGVAHDFNNILTIIMGFSELILRKLPQKDPNRENLSIIFESGKKAANLTRQLLAFSRKQKLTMRMVNPGSIVNNMNKLLERLLGEDIKCEFPITKQTKNILADAGQIEQILMNLAVNARDAMPKGGRLKIDIEDTNLDEEYTSRHEGLKPGPFVMLAVTDTGEGMPPDVKRKIFEPFFTTKQIGKGTGLGLATVYGIVKQHNGYIYVYSEPGLGTTFKIFFPAREEKAETVTAKEFTKMPGGTETILVVDDDPSILQVINAILAPLGYKIHLATSADEAMRIVDNHPDGIDLLLTDIVLPETKGPDLATCIMKKTSHIKTLFMSGYLDTSAMGNLVIPDENFIQKPLVPSILAQKAREALDR